MTPSVLAFRKRRRQQSWLRRLRWVHAHVGDEEWVVSRARAANACCSAPVDVVGAERMARADVHEVVVPYGVGTEVRAEGARERSAGRYGYGVVTAGAEEGMMVRRHRSRTWEGEERAG